MREKLKANTVRSGVYKPSFLNVFLCVHPFVFRLNKNKKRKMKNESLLHFSFLTTQKPKWKKNRIVFVFSLLNSQNQNRLDANKHRLLKYPNYCHLLPTITKIDVFRKVAV